jgi:hypothetical protein
VLGLVYQRWYEKMFDGDFTPGKGGKSWDEQVTRGQEVELDGFGN